MCSEASRPGSGVRRGSDGADGRGTEAPAADSAAVTSSSLAPASASITRSSAPLTSVRVTARCRRRTRVLDRQRQQLLAGRADLYGRVHLRSDDEVEDRASVATFIKMLRAATACKKGSGNAA